MFWWPNEITSEIKDFTVKSGDETIECVEFTCWDNTIKTTKKAFDNWKTEEASDLTTLRDSTCFPAVEDILKSLLSHGVRHDDISFIMQRVATSLDANQQKAIASLFKTKHMWEVSLLHVHEFLVKE